MTATWSWPATATGGFDLVRSHGVEEYIDNKKKLIRSECFRDDGLHSKNKEDTSCNSLKRDAV